MTNMRYALSHLGVVFMRVLAFLPLPLIRAMGFVLGRLLYLIVIPRRKVALVNLRLCFPNESAAQHRAWAKQCFVYFAQTWLDRSWLWHARPEIVQRRLKMSGDVSTLDNDEPVILFAPHFLGMDAGATAVSMRWHQRVASTIYSSPSDPILDQWIQTGRKRFGDVHLHDHFASIRPIMSSLRSGGMLYLLPDMNLSGADNLFVPFFGVQAATVPSLSRFARLGKAKVVPIITRITATGYETQVHPAWKQFPTDDVYADTLRMNAALEGYILAMPAQYYWVHKRFKTRPLGEPSVY